ncbi:Peptidase M1, alanyl aminopeptidase, C-terminal [Dillenia turbinata]|uniref:Peptidase M1, alanyl aminopeptidase, C-terminal n=1 Tax=Dillenia turbinata TaxID=194707 RepID=A0AAN8WGX3_9MAGN
MDWLMLPFRSRTSGLEKWIVHGMHLDWDEEDSIIPQKTYGVFSSCCIRSFQHQAKAICRCRPILVPERANQIGQRLICADVTETLPKQVEEPKMDTPKEIFLKDYKSHDYFFDTVDLKFSLGEETIVSSKICVSAPLVLDGLDPKLLSLNVPCIILIKVFQLEEDFKLDSYHLTLLSPPSGTFTLEIDTEIYPRKNTSLEVKIVVRGFINALGISVHNATQRDSEKLHSIRLVSWKNFYVLETIINAFQLDYLDHPDIMAQYTCHIEADKALYPVLLSNGNLIEQGDLEDLPKTEHAMYSLKAAMKWDEDIFNSKLVLASPETVTDTGCAAILGVIDHEELLSDTGTRTAKQIADVSRLRNYQFPQDAGPMAHPVRPHSYIKVYEKGTEVVRIYKILLGSQHKSRSTPGQPVKEPMFIPVSVGLLDSNGKDMPLTSLYHYGTLQSIAADTDVSDSDLFFLLAHDSDEFNRASTCKEANLSLGADFQQNKSLVLNPKFVHGLRSMLSDSSLDKEFIVKAITLPGEGEIMDMMEVADPDAVHDVPSFIRKQLASELRAVLLSTKGD